MPSYDDATKRHAIRFPAKVNFAGNVGYQLYMSATAVINVHETCARKHSHVCCIKVQIAAIDSTVAYDEIEKLSLLTFVFHTRTCNTFKIADLGKCNDSLVLSQGLGAYRDIHTVIQYIGW
jgi:hypothetical protein